MRAIVATSLMLALSGGIALAQTSGGASSGGASGGAAPGAASGAAPSAPGAVRPGISPATRNPALNPTVTAPSNTQVLPPSRGLQSPAPRATSPGGLSQPGAANTTTGTPTPGAVVPGAQQPEASGGSRAQPGGANSSAQSRDNRTGKNAANEEHNDCMRLWDQGTHMTKQEWSRTCRRVQGRLNQVQIK